MYGKSEVDCLKCVVQKKEKELISLTPRLILFQQLLTMIGFAKFVFIDSLIHCM